MKASEAREIVSNYNLKHMAGIYSKIKEAAQRGDISIHIDEYLSTHTVKQLESDGYIVSNVGCDDIFGNFGSNRYKIAW